MYITASKLYDYIRCPHRVWRDAHGPQDQKIKENNPFVELLWQRGVVHEEKIINQMGVFVDMREGNIERRFQLTLEAMQKGASLIYQGVIKDGALLGEPDLIERLPNGRYIPVDIKSGRGFEGADDFDDEDGKPKIHYAVQLSLYVEVLVNLGFADEHKGVIIDIFGKRYAYDLDAPQGVRNAKTFWQEYQDCKEEVRILLENRSKNHPALSSSCKLCPWYISCKTWCNEHDDPTTLFYLGRRNRDAIARDLNISSVDGLIDLDVSSIVAHKKKNKDFLKGIGEPLLAKFINRAKIKKITKKPVLHEVVNFPEAQIELFFDIEDDPTQDFVYLHGVYERRNGQEKFYYFVAERFSQDAEREAWKKFWEYVRALPAGQYAVYYFAHHEKSTYKRLMTKYPDVVSDGELNEFFSDARAFDLYQKIQKYTDWPLSSYSLKELATYLGFKWRDETPSGALSIQWFNKFLETGDGEVLKRILEYNEDDCRATMILKDGICNLRVTNE